MYIEHVPNRNSPPAILLRESYRDGNKVRKRTLANLSSLPAEVIEGLQVLLRGGGAWVRRRARAVAQCGHGAAGGAGGVARLEACHSPHVARRDRDPLAVSTAGARRGR